MVMDLFIIDVANLSHRGAVMSINIQEVGKRIANLTRVPRAREVKFLVREAAFSCRLLLVT